MDTLH